MTDRYRQRGRRVSRRGRGHGQGRIAGTAPGLVTVEGVPASRDVVLLLRPEQTVFARTVSKPDGTYAFNYLDQSARFTVTCWDRHNVLNAFTADNITPALMPEFEP